ncbi:MAG: hypothetical protein R2766_13280 [Saprospiraceae bacterium]
MKNLELINNIHLSKPILNKILIVNYSFPPNSGVGGRRWAKFCKYLFKKNIEFEVISFIPKRKEYSNWNQDIEPFKEKVNYIKSNYPQVLSSKPSSLLDKLNYKLALIYARIKVKGNYYDKGAHCKSELLATIRQKINDSNSNISCIIVSVAPFHLAVHVMELIPLYPRIKFIVDFRDPWTQNRTSYGFESLSMARRKIELYSEKKVIQSYHHVISVSEKMNEHFFKLTSDHNRFQVIPNGFDSEDYPSLKKTYSVASNKLNMIFAGSFYHNTDYLIQELKEALKQLRKSDFEIYSSFNFDFYGTKSAEIERLVEEFEIIRSFAGDSKDEIIKKINDADAGLLFLSRDIQYSFSTKFCDYIALKKPIVVFSEEDYTMDYVVSNNIGFGIRSGRIYEDLKDCYYVWKEGNLKFNSVYNDADFNIEKCTAKLIDIIEVKNCL